MTKFISICFGVIANFRFYPLLQRFINRQYIKAFKINLDEFQRLESFKSLNELFTRGLKVKRDFDKDKSIIISPCDSLIMQSGLVQQGKALQIKGFSYSVSRLLGEDVSENLTYVNLYLSPSDYHRYHAPCDMYVESITHFKGSLLPVNLKSLKKNYNLFVRNERVVLKAKDSFGNLLYFVAVGALNVGSMVFYCESNLNEEFKGNSKTFFYRNKKFIKKGEEIGMFKMGSTIVLFVDANVKLLRDSGKVKFGDSLFKMEDKNE